MNRHIAILVLTAAAALTASGCATLGSTSGIATPWGAAGIHSFRPEKNAKAPDAKKVDAQVARLLDDATPANGEEETRVAAR